MKLAIVTYGTEGDTRPLAALGRALMDAGHEIRLLADRSTLGSATALHVPSMALSGDIRQALMPDQAAAAVEKAGGFRDAAKALAQIVNDNTAAWMREAADAAQGCDALIASGLAAFVGFSVAEYLGIKAIGAGLIPISPTAKFPSPFLPPRGVPRWLNRASHRFVNGLLWRAFRKSTNAARASVCHLPRRRRVWSEQPMLYGVSPSLLGEPQDWPAHVRACGQWSVAPPQWRAPQALEAFLAQGEPPIYVGFGSMAGLDRGPLMQTVVATLAGRRALFYPGWSDLDASTLPKNICVIGDTPHHWLFPRTSLVIHHGGSGTTHSAARAGVPSVVVPFAGDQFFWANRLKQLGVASAPVSSKRMRRADLARCIAFAQQDNVKARAAELGARMAQEDGLGLAVAFAEKWLAEPGVKTGPIQP